MVNTDKAIFYYINTIHNFGHCQTQSLRIIYIQSTKDILAVIKLYIYILNYA